MKIWLGVVAAIVMTTKATGIIWSQIEKVSGNNNTKIHPLVHFCQETEITHIFWKEENEKGDSYLMYRQRFPNSKMSETTCLDQKHPLPKLKNKLSFQSSIDGRKLFLAYGAYRESSKQGCTALNGDSCTEVFFTESEDGGINWSSPKKIKRKNMKDTIHRILPSIVYDKESGRLFIFYFINFDLGYVIREPEKTEFESENYASLHIYGSNMQVGLTVDPLYGKDLLHIVWSEDILDNGKAIYYSNSSDRGKNWSRRLQIVGKYVSKTPLTAAFDQHKGVIFVQYGNNNIINMVFSKTQGASWVRARLISYSPSEEHSMTLCSDFGAKTLIFSACPGLDTVSGFVKVFVPSTRLSFFLPYPLGSNKHLKQLGVTGVVTPSSGTIILSMVNTKENEVWILHGSMTYSIIEYVIL